MKTMPQTAEQESLYTVAGVLVMTRPEKESEVSAQLAVIPGVELGANDESGRLVVTVEELPGQHLLTETLHQIQTMPGVLSAALVYSRSEQAADQH